MVKQLQVEKGFPRNISALGFPSRITSIDAALHLRNDHYTVFFTGHECWRYIKSYSFTQTFVLISLGNLSWLKEQRELHADF